MSSISLGVPPKSASTDKENLAAPGDAVPGALMRGWWAVYTKHQHEKKVAELLALKGVEVFLPLYESLHRWKDRAAKVHMPLFPSYLFVREDHDLRLAILSIAGVFQIVTTGGQHARISDAEIDSLRKAVEIPCAVQPHPFVAAGQKVRITSGPLTGVTGVLIRRKNMCRVVISIELLAQSASVEVNEWEIGPESASMRENLPENLRGRLTAFA